MKEIKEKIQKLLFKLLAESGDIILNNIDTCTEDKLDAYQDIVEATKEINDKITYITSETENFK